MSKTVIVKLTKSGANIGPFKISDEFGNILEEGVTKDRLINGIGYTVDDAVSVIVLESTGDVKLTKTISVGEISPLDLINNYQELSTAQLWTHLINTVKYNTFYGNIHPYIIEYPFAYQYNDEILQSIQDYTKAFKYFKDPYDTFTDFDKIELNNKWFNKAVLYNGQQSTGILNLVPKPVNNLQEYMKYPIFETDSKTITYTKSDNFYQYNTFWSIVKDHNIPLFTRSCENLSIDKVVNQENMDYGLRSFKKEPLRAKYLKVRHILDDADDVHLVSQFIIGSVQKSYK